MCVIGSQKGDNPNIFYIRVIAPFLSKIENEMVTRTLTFGLPDLQSYRLSVSFCVSLYYVCSLT